MFGFCSDNECPLDLWNPELERHKSCNVGFSAFAKHEQEKEDIIQQIVELARQGEEISFTIDTDDCFSNEDIAYIQQEVYRRLG